MHIRHTGDSVRMPRPLLPPNTSFEELSPRTGSVGHNILKEVSACTRCFSYLIYNRWFHFTTEYNTHSTIWEILCQGFIRWYLREYSELRILYQQPHSDYTKVICCCQGQSCRTRCMATRPFSTATLRKLSENAERPQNCITKTGRELMFLLAFLWFIRLYVFVVVSMRPREICGCFLLVHIVSSDVFSYWKRIWCVSLSISYHVYLSNTCSFSFLDSVRLVHNPIYAHDDLWYRTRASLLWLWVFVLVMACSYLYFSLR